MLLIALSDAPDACAALQSREVEAGGVAIELAFYREGPGRELVAATAVGTYTNRMGAPGPRVEIDDYARNSTCAPTRLEGKGLGSVTLTGVDDGSYSGTFDFVIGGGERLTGSFKTKSCTWKSAVTCQ